MRLATLCLTALVLCLPLSAIEVRLNILLEDLSISQEGIFLIPEEGEVILLPNLSHDERGFYSMCDVTFICDVCGEKSESPHCEHCHHNPWLLSADLPSKLQALASHVYHHPEVLEMLLLKVETSGSVQGGGGVDHQSGQVVVVAKPDDKPYEFTAKGLS